MRDTPEPAAHPSPRPAATVVVLRPGAHSGIEVLLLRRAALGDQFSGAWVFPGGRLDPGDALAHGYCTDLDDARASEQLGLAHGGLDYYIAAVRECFEEAGLLFARTRASPEQLGQWRAQLRSGERRWSELCELGRLRLDVAQLVYFSHWITPVGLPKRFDTRFFLGAVPEGQVAGTDGAELVEHLWVAPAAALNQSAGTAPRLNIPVPTRSTLAALARFESVTALLAWAAEPREIMATAPRLAQARGQTRPILPDHPAYAEIGRIDPGARGTASYELTPGNAVRLSERVVRVTANNGGLMTGPGTNSYFVGGGARNEWALIDPGPLDEQHAAALLAAAPGPIRWLVVTHTHKDHSPAVALLKAATRARVLGRRAEHAERQDASFMPDQVLQHGERLELPGPCTLRAIHTPGHASNHFCFLLEEEGLLFTGDQIMQASTVVIDPPDGNMARYIASLRALQSEPIEWLAPGHGFLMADPRRVIAQLIQHRLRREAKVLEALHALGPATEAALLARVYEDVPAALHGAAARSLLAHLLKLRDEDVAAQESGHWQVRAAALPAPADRVR